MGICPEYQELVAGKIDGTLSPEQDAAAQAHLSVCPRCAAQARELMAMRRLLEQLPHEQTSPQFMPHLRRELATRRWGLWDRLARWAGEPRLALQLAGAAVAALIVLSCFAWQHGPSPQQQELPRVTQVSPDPDLDDFVAECISRHESAQANRVVWEESGPLLPVSNGGG